MRDKQDYSQDLAEIRSIMERSSRFLSLSGWSGVLAGIYALAGVYIAINVFSFNPDEIVYSTISSSTLQKIIFLAIIVLIFALGTAMYIPYRKAKAKGEKVWNATSRRLLLNLVVPLIAGGALMVILLSKDIIGLIVPLSQIFYGLALFSAGKFTYDEIRHMGMIQMGLGLLSTYFIEHSLLFWAIGFGAVHIIYGIYLHIRYER